MNIVELKITNDPPDQFSIAFDGSSSGFTHYVALFACLSSDMIIGYKRSAWYLTV